MNIAKQPDTVPEKKQLGSYRMPPNDIPTSLKESVAKTVGVGGDDLKIAPARAGGSYYGRVLHADSNFVVQGVGKEGKSAVVHRASDIEYASSSLQWRANNNRLGRGGESAANLQIHYTRNGEAAEKGRAYIYNPERQQTKSQPAASEKSAPAPESAKAASTKALPAEKMPQAAAKSEPSPTKAPTPKKRAARTQSSSEQER